MSKQFYIYEEKWEWCSAYLRIICTWDHHAHDLMVVGFTTTDAVSAYHH